MPNDANKADVEYTSLGVGPWYLLVGKRPEGVWTVSLLRGKEPIAAFDTHANDKPTISLSCPDGKPRAALVGGDSVELVLYDQEGQMTHVLSVDKIQEALSQRG